MHLTHYAAAGLLPTSRQTALWAALWLVEKPLLCEKGLLTRREHEIASAFSASERPVREVHPDSLLRGYDVGDRLVSAEA
jgi:hypothetical protein